jgi:type II secretory pathway pseudopilin PulG
MPRSANRKEEEGALLLLVMVAAAVMVIGIAVAAQAWSSTWRRDSEDELVFRANQYVDAILAYQKEHGGTLPLELGVLAKPGPRRLRYIRKLFRDPINPNGQWGLLYLMPGGQAIYDPVAAQKGQAEQASADSGGDGTTGSGTSGSGMVGVGMSRAGVTPISSFATMGTGGMTPGATVPPALLGAKGAQPGSGFAGGVAGPAIGVPGMGGSSPFSGVLPPPKPGTGTFDADSPSEPPIGWQIVGVISRVTGKRDDRTFKTYKGKEKVSEWMFHIYDRGLPATQTPGLPIPGVPRQSFVGPGFGNKGPLGGISNDGPGGGGGGGRTRGLGTGTGGNGDPNRGNNKP